MRRTTVIAHDPAAVRGGAGEVQARHSQARSPLQNPDPAATEELTDFVDPGAVLSGVYVKAIKPAVIDPSLDEVQLRVGVALVFDKRRQRPAARHMRRTPGLGNQLQELLASKQELRLDLLGLALGQIRLGEQATNILRQSR